MFEQHDAVDRCLEKLRQLLCGDFCYVLNASDTAYFSTKPDALGLAQRAGLVPKRESAASLSMVAACRSRVTMPRWVGRLWNLSRILTA